MSTKLKPLIFCLFAAAVAAVGQGLYIQQLTSKNGSVSFSPASGGGSRVDLRASGSTTNYVIYTNAPGSVATNDLVLGTFYTNTSGSLEWVKVMGQEILAVGGQTQASGVLLMVSNSGYLAFSNECESYVGVSDNTQLAELNTVISDLIPPGGVYYFTNVGNPSSAIILPGTSQVLPLSTTGANPIVVPEPFISVLSFGAVCDGTTDNTVAFSNALKTHLPVFVPGQDTVGNTAGYVVGNLTLSNNILFGYGAHLIFGASYTNYLIQFAPIATNPNYIGGTVNFNRNKLEGLELDGGIALGTNYPGSLGTRHGVYVDAFGTNSTMTDCQVHGFSGVGVFVQSTKPTSPYGNNTNGPPAGPDMGNAFIAGLRVSQCYQAIETAYTNNGDPYDAEYLVFNGCMCYSNYFGFYVASGNIGAVGCSFSRNQVGVCVYPTQNDGHGFVNDCFVNHNNYNVELTNITAGFEFHGDHFIGYVPNGSTNFVVGCARVDFIGNQSANTTWVLDASTNAGVNRIEYPFDYPLYSGDTYTHLNGDVSIVENADTGSSVGLIDSRRLLNSSVGGLTITNATNWGGGAGTAAALTLRAGPLYINDRQPIMFKDSGGTTDGGIFAGNNAGLLNLIDGSTNAFMNLGNGNTGSIGIQFYNSSQNFLNNGNGTCNVGSSNSVFNTFYGLNTYVTGFVELANDGTTPPTVPSGQGRLWASNSASGSTLYWVTSVSTNKLAGP